MANILYGINGEGSGHWTRSKEVINYLNSLGHNVSIVCSGRASANLRNCFAILVMGNMPKISAVKLLNCFCLI